MRIIKVSATQSTNSLAREWYQSNKNQEAVCITAFEQSAGRGQRGAGWVSNAGENLTFSVIFPNPPIDVAAQFVLSAAVGLALLDGLKKLNIFSLKLKWPNDILAGNYKIGGILIENILVNGSIGASIIGIGLNVNQTFFQDLPQASSLKLIAGNDFLTDEVLKYILVELEQMLEDLKSQSHIEILKKYEGELFRKDKVSTFLLPSGDYLTGIILGITSTGLLKVKVEDEVVQTFELKQLKLLY